MSDWRKEALDALEPGEWGYEVVQKYEQEVERLREWIEGFVRVADCASDPCGFADSMSWMVDEAQKLIDGWKQ